MENEQGELNECFLTHFPYEDRKKNDGISRGSSKSDLANILEWLNMSLQGQGPYV